MIKTHISDDGFLAGRRKWYTMQFMPLMALLVFLIAGCTTPTAYAPADVDGSQDGYADYPLEENRYRVIFTGNAVTPRPTVENYLLYRAAEITVETGHDYFRVVDQDTDVSTRYRTTFSGTPAFWPYWRGSYGFGFAPGFTTASSRPITSFQAEIEMVVASGEKPVDDVFAYDALSVMEALGPTIIRPGDPASE